MKRTILLLGVLLTGCAGTHDGDSKAAGSRANPSDSAAAGKGTASAGAASTGAAGTMMARACERTPAKHRESSEMCSLDRAASLEPPSPSGGLGCASDAECTQGKNGRCTPGNRGVHVCSYDECYSDAECTKGGPCICRQSTYDANRCMPGNCRTDADCGADGYCSPSLGSCGNYHGVVGYYCHTCMDECAEDSDCKQPGGYCAYEPTRGHWRCSSSHCVG